MASRQESSVTVLGLVSNLILTKLNAALGSELVHATFGILAFPPPSLEERGVAEDGVAVLLVSMKMYAAN
jgi:hypothetical protein